MAFRKRNLALSRPDTNTQPLLHFISNDLPQARGTRPSPIDGRPTTSTGTPSLDAILAGHVGLPLGNSLLISESGSTDYAGALLRFYAAEGIMQGHWVHVVGMGEAWGRELPGLVGGKGEDGTAKEKQERMKIAWRYEGLGQFESGRGLPMANTTPTNDGTEEPVIFCHTFDLAKRLLLPVGAMVNYIPIPQTAGASLFPAILQNIQNRIVSSPPYKIHRVIIPSLLSPALYPTSACPPTSVLQFLHSLRALLRQNASRLTAITSLSLTLYPRTTGLVRWMEILSDGVLELSPFPYDHSQSLSTSQRATKDEERAQGMFIVHKLPVFYEKGGGSGGDDLGEDLTFTLSRRRFVIAKFSLPPVEGDAEAQDEAAHDSAGGVWNKRELEF